MWRAHDLILVARLPLLQAAGEDTAGGHIGDRDSRSADLFTKHHGSVGYDSHKNRGGFRVVEMRIRRGFVFSGNRKGGERNQDEDATQGEAERNGDRDHFTLVPGSTSSRKVASPRTSLSPAARTIPCDSMPINLAGLRFATMTMVFPTSASGSYFFPMPATICRCSLPSDTWSLSSLSDFGTRSALRTFAVLS